MTEIQRYWFYCGYDGDIEQDDNGHWVKWEDVKDLIKDAGRYRWLRHGDNDDEVIRCDTYGMAFLPRNAELDAAIDAVMAKDGA